MVFDFGVDVVEIVYVIVIGFLLFGVLFIVLIVFY